MDHDQRFKHLIKEFFADFLWLFFDDWAALFDFARVEWLDKELFADPPDGARRILDLVAKLPTKEAVSPAEEPIAGEWLALVHIEIESQDRVASLPARIYDAYSQLRRQHQLPVLPIGLYLAVAKKGIGAEVYQERFGKLETLRFRYLYVGLPGLDAVEYVVGDNWLGVALAALMRVPPGRAAWLAAEALRRIAAAPLADQQRFQLGECVQAYLPMDAEQKQKFAELILSPPYQGVQAMNVTWFEQGEKKGLEQGLEKGQRATLRVLLEERFGLLSPQALERLEQVPADGLLQLTRAALRASSLKEIGLE